MRNHRLKINPPRLTLATPLPEVRRHPPPHQPGQPRQRGNQPKQVYICILIIYF